MKKCYLYFVLLILSCHPDREYKVSKAFYHWKSSLRVDNAKQNQLKKIGISKIYLHYFDIDWNDEIRQAIPKARLTVEHDLDSVLEIVPTIFITNRTFQHLAQDKISDLVTKTQNTVSKISTAFSNPIAEIQFDCDWSATTRDKYFKFLELFKQRSSASISATIRLHQIKYYKKTGIPPVNRGMLMYYNMGDIKAINTENSILDNRIGRQYLAQLNQYPLDLDIALPLYSWGVVFRDGKLIRLINDVYQSDFDPNKYLKISKNRYKVIKSTFLYGNYLYEDDIVRYEAVSPTDLEDAVEILSKKISPASRTISLYHLNSKILDQYEIEFLQKVFHPFNLN